LLSLPPYSADFAPIEPCWAFLKTCLRTLKDRVPARLKAAIARAASRSRTASDPGRRPATSWGARTIVASINDGRREDPSRFPISSLTTPEPFARYQDKSYQEHGLVRPARAL